MKNVNQLIGTWKLISFKLRLEDGIIKYPWGKNIEGQVMYGADGYMAGSLMKQNRTLFESPDVMAAKKDECESAMKSYVGYAGAYSLDGMCVFHHTSVSIFPNWTGIDIKRFYEISDNKLSLSTPPLLFSGVQATAVLVWEKLPALKI